MDLASALALKMLDIEDQVFDNCSPFKFVHMKSQIQNWPSAPENWQEVVHTNLTNSGKLIVGNIKQPALFHYVKKDFIQPYMINTLEGLTYGS